MNGQRYFLKKNKEMRIIIFLLLVNTTYLFPQGVGVGTTSPSTSARLDISSTSQGLLIPRVTTAQRNAIVNPAPGLMVFDVNKKTICMFDGSEWNPLLFSSLFTKLPSVALDPPANLFHAGYFGYDVDVSGNYAIIGSPTDSVNGNSNQGSAFIYFMIDGVWTYQAKLIASDGNAFDFYGIGVSISGDYAIVGAHAADYAPFFTDNGVAYIYQRSGTTWTQIAKLIAPDAGDGDGFGEDVSIDGDYIIVGAPFDDITTQEGRGSAYIFYKGGGWTNSHPVQAKVLASDGLTQDNFGISVSLSGSNALIGAYGDDGAQNNMGSGYIFQRSETAWTQISKLNPDPLINSFYGTDVDLDGDYAIIGADGDNGNRGAAYVYYKGSGWVNNQPYQTKLIASDAAVNHNMGSRVRITNQFAFMGGGYYDNEFTDQGAIYLYKRTGTAWSLYRRLLDETPSANSLFGRGIGVSGYELIIGAANKFNLQGQIQSLNIE